MDGEGNASPSATQRWTYWFLLIVGALMSVPVLLWFFAEAHLQPGPWRSLVVGSMLWCGPLLFLVHGVAAWRFYSKGLRRQAMAMGAPFLVGLSFVAYLVWIIGNPPT